LGPPPWDPLSSWRINKNKNKLIKYTLLELSLRPPIEKFCTNNDYDMLLIIWYIYLSTGMCWTSYALKVTNHCNISCVSLSYQLMNICILYGVIHQSCAPPVFFKNAFVQNLIFGSLNILSWNCFYHLIKKCLVAIQISVFRMTTLPFLFTVNYLVVRFFENFDVPNLKFGRVVSQLLKCLLVSNIEITA